MAELTALQKMYYIIDSFGNYYRLNEKKELVVAAARREAELFSYLEAHEKVGKADSSKYYTAVAADEIREEMDDTLLQEKDYSGKLNGNQSGILKACCFKTTDDLKQINWAELLWQLRSINVLLPCYIKELGTDQMENEMEIQDLLHYVEFYDYAEENVPEFMERLREAREKRRIIKNEINRIKQVHEAIGSKTIGDKFKKGLEAIKGIENGTYKPRISPELFDNVKMRPRHLHKCYADRDMMIKRKTVEDYIETENAVPAKEKEAVMQKTYERAGTILDSMDIDWNTFIHTQASIFRNLEQYMNDLQCDLDSIDTAIEESLEAIETANYNVTQGYRAFKELKDLRNERKDVQAELQKVESIITRFDCTAMAEAYEEIEEEIKPEESGDLVDIKKDSKDTEVVAVQSVS